MDTSGSSLTVTEILSHFEAEGYTGQTVVREGGRLQCLECRAEVDARDVELRELCRTEGASDPDDMLAVAALVCPRCGAKATAIFNYGPESSEADAEVLLALEDRRRG